MVGGTRIHRWIHEASLGRDEKGFRCKREENESFETRKLSVSLDRADNVIEVARPSPAFGEGREAFDVAFGPLPPRPPGEGGPPLQLRRVPLGLARDCGAP